MDKKIIEKALAAFSFGQMQDFITMHTVMAKSNISVSHLQDYVETERKRQMEADRLWKKLPDCPACGNKLAIQAINLPKGPRNRNGWKSLWYCPAENCVHENYSTMTVEEQLIKYGLNPSQRR